MLAVEKAKTSLGKAEKKVAKAQALLKSRTSHLSTLESHLAELRASQQGSEVSSDQQQGQPETAGNTENTAKSAGSPSDMWHQSHTSIPANHVSSEPPVEWRADLPPGSS